MIQPHIRTLKEAIRADLSNKMVFLGGPRQVGKTTLSKMLGATFSAPEYFNWDNRTHRQSLLKNRWSPEADLLVFDELHKYTRWKGWIKGIWDTRQNSESILVTGSSRLDVFRRGGDSLLGRYHYYRLHPFSVAELEGCEGVKEAFPKQPPELRFTKPSPHLERLLCWGGFPEPLFSESDRTLRRWQKERFERVFREDIRDTENIRSLSQVELLGQLLPERVASPLSFQSLAEDLEASPKTVKSWMELLCRNYYAFKIPPYHRRIDRALKKEAKYYLWDWTEIADEGARFENLIASHLLKFCHYYEDVFGISAELYYVRDTLKREVDFLVVWEKQPWLLVEAKSGPEKKLPSLVTFAEALHVQHRFQVCRESGLDYADKSSGIRTISADRFLTAFV
jgi:predicted AAA+ superfamily ATPase